ncbi:hypothetical protein LJ739_18195 [Aestuariibacter halophilus]|uniref:WD40-like Beta Propeller Repeat n=1 Tax=Fluctibacter halophilus TaxID=226011 RepID=A0ABS8GCF3_9ALTE|nr:hypothetical protein [Aestuariibacter halophilus]MCC2618193.1 hypothetical protein [Aestuariibacter halophilus]
MLRTRLSGLSVALTISLLATPLALAHPKKLPEGPYIGQTSPGQTPQPFAPGIVSTPGYEYSGVFTPDLNEFYFIRGAQDNKSQEFVQIKNHDGQWHTSVISPRKGQPFVAPDGQTLHLGRRYMTREGNGWSEVKFLPEPFKDMFIMRLTASANGNLYFDTYDADNDEFPIRYARRIDGGYAPPQPLDDTINTGKQLNHPFIAPDESYLIWDAKRDDGHGGSDLYISYRQADGSWGEGINLGDKINTPAWDAAGHVTPDGKYFFFQRMIDEGPEGELPDVDIYWVEASFIDELRPKAP